MCNPKEVHELIEAVCRAYGSLEEPNYAFMEKKYKTLQRHPFIAEIMLTYFIKDETDLNDHASMHLRVLHADGTLEVCLSFIDDLAMLFRYDAGGVLYSKVIDSSVADILPAEREIIEMLIKHRFRLLSKDEAAIPIDMNLFNTDSEDVRLYHAVISDDGCIPQVLLPYETD